MKFRQIGHITSQYGQWFPPKTISAWNGDAFAEATSLAVFRSNFLLNWRASLPHNTIEGSSGIFKQKLPKATLCQHYCIFMILFAIP